MFLPCLWEGCSLISDGFRGQGKKRAELAEPQVFAVSLQTSEEIADIISRKIVREKDNCRLQVLQRVCPSPKARRRCCHIVLKIAALNKTCACTRVC